MATTNDLHTHLTACFVHYSTQELIALNNDIVGTNWGSSRGTFRSALLSALATRGIDLSAIMSKQDGFTTILRVAVRLEENRLVPATHEG